MAQQPEKALVKNIRALMVVEDVLYRGLNKSQCMDCTPGQKKLGRCGEVAVNGGSTVAFS